MAETLNHAAAKTAPRSQFGPTLAIVFVTLVAVAAMSAVVVLARGDLPTVNWIALAAFAAIAGLVVTVIGLHHGSLRRGQESLGQRIDDLSQSTGQRIDGLSQRIDDLSQSTGQRIDGLSQRIDDLGQSTGQRIDDLSQSTGQRIDGLSQRIDDVGRSTGQRIDRMEIQFDALRSDMQRQFERLISEIRGLGDKIQALTERMATTEGKVEMLASNGTNDRHGLPAAGEEANPRPPGVPAATG